MNINRTSLLAGVAALALMAGTGFASAQQQQQKGHNPAPQAAQLHAVADQSSLSASPLSWLAPASLVRSGCHPSRFL
jgi:uncharacterized membrane protein YebE (DUF533 family)